MPPDTAQATSPEDAYLIEGLKRICPLSFILPSSLHLNSACCYVIFPVFCLFWYSLSCISFVALSPILLPLSLSLSNVRQEGMRLSQTFLIFILKLSFSSTRGRLCFFFSEADAAPTAREILIQKQSPSFGGVGGTAIRLQARCAPGSHLL